MKFGFVTAILPELSFDNVLNFARHEGFSTVEVMCWPVGKAERKYAGVTHIDVTTLTKTKAQEILGHCQDQGVSISALGYYPNMLDPDAAVSRAGVSHFKKVIAAAPKLGVGLVTGFEIEQPAALFTARHVDAQIACDREDPGRRTGTRAIELLGLAPHCEQSLLRQLLGGGGRCAAAHQEAFDARREIIEQRGKRIGIPMRSDRFDQAREFGGRWRRLQRGRYWPVVQCAHFRKGGGRQGARFRRVRLIDHLHAEYTAAGSIWITGDPVRHSARKYEHRS